MALYPVSISLWYYSQHKPETCLSLTQNNGFKVDKDVGEQLGEQVAETITTPPRKG